MNAALSRFRRMAAVGLLATAVWLPTVVVPEVAAGTACTSWSSSTTPPPTIRVLRTGTGLVETVDFRVYTKIVMAAEFNKTWPFETLRAGAVAVKEYAWYYVLHPRGGSKNGSCYDVQDNSSDQDYWPETRYPSTSEINAVDTTWGESVLRGGAVFLAGYRSGTSLVCGGDRDGYHLWQLSARECGLEGKSAETILHIYFDPVAIQGGPVVPGAPTAVSATGFDTSALVTWSVPASSGGTSITGYTATSDPDGKTCSTTGTQYCEVAGLMNLTSYTFTVRATNNIGTGPSSDPSNAVTPAVVHGSTFAAIKPVRLLDTRVGNGLGGKFLANTPRTFQVSKRDVIPAGATAVTGDLTVVGESGPSAIYLGPDPIAYPSTSTINFKQGDVIGNGVMVALSSNGELSATYLAASGQTTDLVFDATGYFTAAASGDRYHPLDPARLVDSRLGLGLGGKVRANTPATFTVWNHAGVPIGATAVTGNVTVVNATHSGAVFVGPDPIAKPTTSTINFKQGQVIGNNVTVALSTKGQLNVTFMSASGNTTDLVFDITGYYTADGTGDTYVPIQPIRLLDTRFKNGLSGKFSSNTPGTFQVSGRGCVPATATAVSGNVAVVNQTRSYAVFVGPKPTASPSTSTLNFPSGIVRANGLAVALSTTGTLSATYMSAAGQTTDLVFDVTGYFQPSPK